jgi:hypothetical protein
VICISCVYLPFSWEFVGVALRNASMTILISV